MIEATTREREQALSDGNDLLRNSSIRGVKVFKETLNLETNQAAAISIFSHMKPESKRPRMIASLQRQARPVALKPAAKPEPIRRPGNRSHPSREEKSGMGMFVAITLVLMALAAGIYLLTISYNEADTASNGKADNPTVQAVIS